MLVRKAILLQFEDTADGTPQEVEAALEAAIERDDNYIEAYIELGHYYFAVQDNAQRARSSFLKALNLLRDMNVEIIRCLVECDEELHPEIDPAELKATYERKLLNNGGVEGRPEIE